MEKFIFAETFPTKNTEIDNHLLENKDVLMKRKIKKFSEKNWFEWGAPRNISSIRNNWGKDCIYIKNMTRNKEVAFTGKVQYFGGSLLCLIPKKNIDLKKIVEYLNSKEFQKITCMLEDLKLDINKLVLLLFLAKQNLYQYLLLKTFLNFHIVFSKKFELFLKVLESFL